MCYAAHLHASTAGAGKDGRVTHSTPQDLARTRREYSGELTEYAGELTEANLAPTWTGQFGAWLAEAAAADVVEVNAMVLATADASGAPSARNVLLKGYDEGGLVFFTNHDSRKARELAENPRASAVFGWLPLHRQVIVCGSVRRISREETEAYFAMRPRGAQIGAWASQQSSVLTSRVELERAASDIEERFADQPILPAPPGWGGYRLVPDTVEFWQGRPNRLHDRLRFRRAGEDWIVERLAP
jgi:pyridoxamine 5'-phosphate oxidase